MATASQCIKYFASLGKITVVPQVTKVRYKVNNKVALTHNVVASRFCLTLSVEDQAEVAEWQPEFIHAVPNKFGLLGYTLVYYESLELNVVKRLLDLAYKNGAEVKLKSEKPRPIVKTEKGIKFYKQLLSKNAVVYFSIKANEIQQQLVIDHLGKQAKQNILFKEKNCVAIDASVYERILELWQV
jgi:hypothetical protein